LTGHFFFNNNTISNPVEVISDTDFPSERFFLCPTLASCGSTRQIRRQAKEVRVGSIRYARAKLSLNSSGIGKKRRGDAKGFREADDDRA
jgi:hypothetical protein